MHLIVHALRQRQESVRHADGRRDDLARRAHEGRAAGQAHHGGRDGVSRARGGIRDAAGAHARVAVGARAAEVRAVANARAGPKSRSAAQSRPGIAVGIRAAKTCPRTESRPGIIEGARPPAESRAGAGPTAAPRGLRHGRHHHGGGVEVPEVHIHPVAIPVHRAVRGVLPHVVVPLELVHRIVLRDPDGIVAAQIDAADGLGQEVQVRIQARRPPPGQNGIAEHLHIARGLRAGQFGLRQPPRAAAGKLVVHEDRQVQIDALQEVQGVVRLRPGLHLIGSL